MLDALHEQRHGKNDRESTENSGTGALRLDGAFTIRHVQPEHRIRRAHENADAGRDELEIGNRPEQVGAAEYE